MNLNEDNIIGIVGGMGPQAGQALFDKIIHHTKAAKDQDHISVIMMSFPKHIVDRTAFLEGTISVNPAFNIAKIISRLEKCGASIVGMPCNTSHSPAILDVIHSELQKSGSRIKLVNMPKETGEYIHIAHPGIRKIGVMTTNGTYRSELYKNLLLAHGYEVVIPDAGFQNDVIHRMIYDPRFGIKSTPEGIADEVNLLLDKAFRFFAEKRAEAVILGCTELSLLFREKEKDGMAIVDALDVLARSLIRETAGRGVKGRYPAALKNAN